MNEEMRSKFNRLSRVLVEGLEERDALVGELDVKNRFVAAILRVQSLRVSNGDDSRGRKRAWSLKQADERGTRKVSCFVVCVCGSFVCGSAVSPLCVTLSSP